MYAHTHACVQQSLKEEAMSLKESFERKKREEKNDIVVF